MDEFERHTRSLYCYEDELPCELTMSLFIASIVDGVRLYPWSLVAEQLEIERDEARQVAAKYYLRCKKLKRERDALQNELANVLDVAIARGEKLDYMDDDYRERLAALRPSGDSRE